MEKIEAAVELSAERLAVNVPAPTEAQALGKRIENAIRRGSGGRIHKLRVEIARGQVLLFGFCSSYYAKQLAQHAAMPLVEDGKLINQIEVW